LKIKSEKSKGQNNMIRNKEMHKARNLALLRIHFLLRNGGAPSSRYRKPKWNHESKMT
jgi:hypothetical protein